MSSIHHSFRVGSDGESFITNIFHNNGIECEKNSDINTKYDYDLICKLGKKRFTCEVKFDMMAVKTNNLAIEYHNSKQDKPSGLSATKANLWAHVILDGENKTGWLTSVYKLKEFCKSITPFKHIKSGGDKNANLLIYQCDTILPIFTRIEMLNDKELHQVIKTLLKDK